MSKFLRFFSKLTLSFFALFTLFSCSKDADLLSEYVINKNDDQQSLTILTNDSFFMAAGQNTILMDVLNNDNLSANVNVTIIETSAPLNGIVTINDDNTLTYRTGETIPEETTPEETIPEETTPEETTPEETTPEETTSEDDNTPEEQSTTEDTFTYTAEVVDEETGTVTVEEAIVTVTNSENILPTTGDNVYYVTTEGKSSNNGKSEQSAWDIEHGFKAAKAGDIIYIKAGVYSDFEIEQSDNGTIDNPIKFIGYNSTPGDINADAQKDYTLGTQTIKVMSSFSYGDSVDSTKMPLIRESRSGDIGLGTALTIRGSYVHLSNIQTLYYENGLYNHGNFNVFKNLIHVDLGDLSKDVRDGNGVYNYGDNCSYKNIYVENAADQGFSIKGNNSTFDAISVVADNTINSTDYYFLFQEGHDNYATNIYNFRKGNLQHRGHGITYKTPYECYNNTVDKFIIDNTRAEVQFPGVHDNTLKNGYIIQTASSTTGGGLRLANGSYDNTYSNIFIENSTIFFMDWDDGLAGDSDVDSSDGNVFNQITVINAKDCVAFNHYGNGLTDSSADNNTFYNCTFYNNTYMFETSRKNTNSKFINCIFSDISRFSHTATGYTEQNLDVSIVNSNVFEIGFTSPEVNTLLNLEPQFVNPSSKNFALKSTSGLKSVGVATPFLDAGNDLGSFQN
ncbi:hypothetical protein [Maribacter sp. 1_2014MBL_MicDiv]|uniref:hypothetical protein n=1 Tax=Maribacter sp. 1_2014MBL_MicDiv TaxID=1644130 RepID=UPI0008F48CA1|nr:hypothetical protein [Maribacter sp. 1_2014MBL_MicDiv]APA65502.1 hypothetical protein YQ22_14970 [Maribacter sp. 1_2014MBL_MicDiv]